MNEYENIKESLPGHGWLLLLIFVLLILGSGMLVHHGIQASQPEWDFGALPDAPGESRYSISQPGKGPVPRQIAVLPEAVTGPVHQVEYVSSDRRENTP